MTEAPIIYARTPSPIGELVLAANGQGLTGLYVPGHQAIDTVISLGTPDESPFGTVIGELDEYWSAKRTDFSVPIAPVGTPFQLAVWKQLRRIPYGGTVSYLDLAKRIGRPSAARAVGSANARNPISILIPCHRVVGSAGSLTGYAGGLDRKRWLLAHESTMKNGKPGKRVESEVAAQERGHERLTSSS